MATKTTKTFDPATADLTTINRELKRLASRKCRAKSDADRMEAATEYARVDAVKQSRFGQKHYRDWTADEIATANLETATKATKSLQSAKTLYPEKHDEILPKLAEWMQRRDELLEVARLHELAAKHGLVLS